MHSTKNLIITIFATIIIYLVIFAFSKIVRDIFAPPEILNSKIVGFAHYYGYSLYFDYVFLFAVIFAPIVIIISFYFIFKTYGKKN